MAVTVVDATNMEHVLADARGEKLEAPKAEVKVEEPKEEPKVAEEDEEEDENGLTASQKKEMSAKMLKAVGKKHRQKMEAEEFAAAQYKEKLAAKAEAEEAKRQLKEMQERAKPKKEDKPPKREDFATDSEYIKAEIKYGVEQGLREAEAQRQQEAIQQRIQDQLQRAHDLVPDFAEVTSGLTVQIPPAIIQYMCEESDMYAELGYHFAKNPSLIEKLRPMTGVRQLAEIGKIEATLRPFGKESVKDSTPVKEEPKVVNGDPPSTETGKSPSKARSDAPVIRPLTSGDGQAVEKSVDEMNIREHITHWSKSNSTNLHARKRH